MSDIPWCLQRLAVITPALKERVERRRLGYLVGRYVSHDSNGRLSVADGDHCYRLHGKWVLFTHQPEAGFMDTVLLRGPTRLVAGTLVFAWAEEGGAFNHCCVFAKRPDWADLLRDGPVEIRARAWP